MEWCYNGFVGYEADIGEAGLEVYQADLCGYMYLLNFNQTLLAQYADLSYYQGVADPAYAGLGYYRRPGTTTSSIGPVLFKDLGHNSAYGGSLNIASPFPSYLGATLYANMACAYEHWGVSGPLLKLPVCAHWALESCSLGDAKNVCYIKFKLCYQIALRGCFCTCASELHFAAWRSRQMQLLTLSAYWPALIATYAAGLFVLRGRSLIDT